MKDTDLVYWSCSGLSAERTVPLHRVASSEQWWQSNPCLSGARKASPSPSGMPPGQEDGAGSLSSLPSSSGTAHSCSGHRQAEWFSPSVISLEQPVFAFEAVPEGEGDKGRPSALPPLLGGVLASTLPLSSSGKHQGCPPTYPAGCNQRWTSKWVSSQPPPSDPLPHLHQH